MAAQKLATALIEIKTTGFNELNNEFTKTHNLLSSAVQNITQQAAGMLAAFGFQRILSELQQFTVGAVKLAADLETLTVAFEVLTGSAEKAAKLLAEIREFANNSPFNFAGLTESAKLLMQFGVAAEDILPTLQMLGDVSAGNQAKLNSMALAFGQIASTGRLMGQDLLQLINAGFNPLQEISKRTGESMADLKKRMEDWLVSFAEVKQAFIDATSEGGRFHGMTERIGQTTSGLWSTMADSIDEVKRAFGELVIEGLDAQELLKNFTAAAGELTAAMNESGPELKKSLEEVAASMSMIMTTLTGSTERAEQFRIVLEALAKAIHYVAEALKLLDLALQLKNLKEFDFGKAMKGDFGGMKDDFSDKIKNLKDRYDSITEPETYAESQAAMRRQRSGSGKPIVDRKPSDPYVTPQRTQPAASMAPMQSLPAPAAHVEFSPPSAPVAMSCPKPAASPVDAKCCGGPGEAAKSDGLAKSLNDTAKALSSNSKAVAAKGGSLQEAARSILPRIADSLVDGMTRFGMESGKGMLGLYDKSSRAFSRPEEKKKEGGNKILEKNAKEQTDVQRRLLEEMKKNVRYIPVVK